MHFILHKFQVVPAVAQVLPALPHFPCLPTLSPPYFYSRTPILPCPSPTPMLSELVQSKLTHSQGPRQHREAATHLCASQSPCRVAKKCFMVLLQHSFAGTRDEQELRKVPKYYISGSQISDKEAVAFIFSLWGLQWSFGS